MGGSRDLNLHKSWNPKLQQNRKKIENTEKLVLERQKSLAKQAKDNEIENHASINKHSLSWMYQDPTITNANKDTKPPTRQQREQSSKVQKPSKNTKTFDYSKEDPMNLIKRK